VTHQRYIPQFMWPVIVNRFSIPAFKICFICLFFYFYEHKRNALMSNGRHSL